MKFIYAKSEVKKEAVKSTCLFSSSEGIPGLQRCANVSCMMQRSQEKWEHSSELLGQAGSSQKAATDQQHITSSFSLLLVWECWCKAPEGVRVPSLLQSHTLIKTRCHCQPSNPYLRSLKWNSLAVARPGCTQDALKGHRASEGSQGVPTSVSSWCFRARASPKSEYSAPAMTWSCVSWTWKCFMGVKLQTSRSRNISLPSQQSSIWINITFAKRQFQHHLRQWGKEDEKFSLSFTLYWLKRKRLPREIIFTPLNTT